MNRHSTVRLALLLLMGCALFLSTCSKDYSYEGGPINGGTTGLAKYWISNTAGNCAPATVSGKYFTGTQLTADNTVELEVNVSSVGTYILNTNMVNGIQFTASGFFTSTGTQNIILKGGGTPLAEGSFSFVSSDSSKCLFSLVVTKPIIPIAQYTLAGSPGNCNDVLVQGTYTAGWRLDFANTATITVDVAAAGAYSIHTDTLNGISFSASGNFMYTGIQKVVLVGSGTPQNPRNLVFSPLGDSSTCMFTISVANRQPLATYVLESGGSATNPCIYAVSGNYKAGTPLSPDNTVSVSVYVTVPGNFTIATQTVNGIDFSYTGNFTSTGGQTVILQGNGTPTAKGTFSFTPAIVGPSPIGGAACSISIVVN